MNGNTRLILSVLTLLAACLSAACGGGSSPEPEPVVEGTPLAVIEFDDTLGTWGIRTQVFFGLGYSPDFINFTAVFDDVPISTAHAGTTRAVAPGLDIDFGTVAARLTDGTDDTIHTTIGTSAGALGSRFALESVWIAGGLSGGLLPDAVGHLLVGIKMEIDTVTFDSPGTDPNNDGDWTDIRIRGRFILLEP